MDQHITHNLDDIIYKAHHLDPYISLYHYKDLSNFPLNH